MGLCAPKGKGAGVGVGVGGEQRDLRGVPRQDGGRGDGALVQTRVLPLPFLQNRAGSYLGSPSPLGRPHSLLDDNTVREGRTV